jgi:hypothetical protein
MYNSIQCLRILTAFDGDSRSFIGYRFPDPIKSKLSTCFKWNLVEYELRSLGNVCLEPPVYGDEGR